MTLIRSLSAAALCAAALAAALPSAPARAAGAEDFYKGRTLTIVVALGPSGSYALYAQLMQEHFARHMPGSPKVIPQFMEGGGGTKGANYLYNVAPKDGSVLGVLSDYSGVAQIVRPAAVKYDVREFRWVGQFVPSNPVVMVQAAAGVRNVQEAMSREVVMGTTGKSAPGFVNMSVMNAVLGTRFKIIPGYKDTGATELAMERGEVMGSAAAWMSWTARSGHLLASGKLVPLVQIGLKRVAQLPNVPTLVELAKTDADRELLAFISSGGALGRSVTATPGIPAERLTALRRAFDAMVQHPAFVAEAARRKLDLEPGTGEELQEAVKRSITVSPEVAARARAIFAGG